METEMETDMDEQTLKETIKSEKSSLQAELEIIRADRLAFAADLEELRRERALLQAEKDEIRAEREALEAERRALKVAADIADKVTRQTGRLHKGGKKEKKGLNNHTVKPGAPRNQQTRNSQQTALKVSIRLRQKFGAREEDRKPDSNTHRKGKQVNISTSSLGKEGTAQLTSGPTTRQKRKRRCNKEEGQKNGLWKGTTVSDTDRVIVEEEEAKHPAGYTGREEGPSQAGHDGRDTEGAPSGEDQEDEGEDAFEEDVQEEDDFQEDAQHHLGGADSCESLARVFEKPGDGLEDLPVSFDSAATEVSPDQDTGRKVDNGDLDGGDDLGGDGVKAVQGTRKVRKGSSNAPHICQHCGKPFRLTSRYLAHLKTHTGELKSHLCSKCPATFAELKQLTRHLNQQPSNRTAHAEQEQQQNACSSCGLSFTTSTLLQKHVESAHRKRSSKPGGRARSKQQLTCVICGESFTKASHLVLHMGVHSEGKPFKCPDCHSSFTSPGNLTVHMKKHRGDKPFKCQECGATFPRSADLKSHARKHSTVKPYKCGICSAAFCRAGDLKPHMRTHTGEKPFQCEKCGAAFSTSSNLAVHRRTHSGERPFQCEQCGDSFSQLGHLTRHRLQHSTEHSHPCPACPAAFGNAYHLKVHMQRHNTENTYKCKCGAAFSRASILTEHMRIHTGEKPYKCNQCPAAFARSANLAAHRRKHTGERPYCCPHCQQCFTQSTSLNRHLQSKNACLSRRAPSSSQLNSANTKPNSADTKLNNANTQLSSAGTQLNSANAHPNNTNTQLNSANAHLNNTNAQFSSANTQLDNINLQLSAGVQLDNASPQVSNINPQLTTQLNSANSQLTSANTQLNSANPQLATANTQLNSANPQLACANAQPNSANAQLASANTQPNSANSQLASANTQLNSANPQLASASTQLNSANPQLASASTQLSNAVGPAEGLKNGLGATGDGNAALQASAGQFHPPAGEHPGAETSAQTQGAPRLPEAGTEPQTPAGGDGALRPLLSFDAGTETAVTGKTQPREGDETVQLAARGDGGPPASLAERAQLLQSSRPGGRGDLPERAPLAAPPLLQNSRCYDSAARSHLEPASRSTPAGMLVLERRDLYTPPAPVMGSGSAAVAASPCPSSSSSQVENYRTPSTPSVAAGSAEGHVHLPSPQHKFGFRESSQSCALTPHSGTSARSAPVVSIFSSPQASLPSGSYQLQQSSLYAAKGSGGGGSFCPAGIGHSQLNNGTASAFTDAARLAGNAPHMGVSLGDAASSASAMPLPPSVAMVTGYESGGGGDMSSAESLLALRELSQSTSYFQSHLASSPQLSHMQLHPQ